MTPDASEAVHNFIRFSMEAQEKMGKRFTEEDLEQEIHECRRSSQTRSKQGLRIP